MMLEPSLNDFYRWVETNKSELLHDFDQSGVEDDVKLKEQFVKDWPLERISSMKIDDYIVGKGRKNKSFCYELESGKYASLGLGIKGGTAGKFGIYYSKANHSYCNQNNEVISIDQSEELFEQIKKDLVEILTKGLNREFDDVVFNKNNSTNLFFGKSAITIKLLYCYSKESYFCGFNTGKNQKEFWSKLVKPSENGWVYKQNYDITRILSDKYKELNVQQIGIILWKYRNYILSSDTSDINSEVVYKNKYSKILIDSKNVIFHGAPGTGKSYLAKEVAADIVSNGSTTKYGDLTEEEKQQIEFVQFHPSYDYTDFVEGLRPILSNGIMTFDLEQGIFSKFVSKARDNYENSKKPYETLLKEKKVQKILIDFFSNIEFETQPFKTSRGTLFYITGVDNQSINIFIPNNPKINSIVLNMEELTEMLKSKKEFNQVKDVTKFFNKVNATQNYSYDLALFKVIKSTYKSDDVGKDIRIKEKPFVFIIDEINRGEISKIFGELFFSIDPGYRGKEGSVSTQYSNLHDNDKKFYVPRNVYIIGTMNDIDRSVDSIDFAMRRRFRFINIKADSQINMLDSLKEKDDAIKRMRSLNAAIINDTELNEDYQVGAAYFLKLKEISYQELWNDYLEPLLHDYVRGMYSEKEDMMKFENAYFLKDEK
ncbi:McrB family protein [Companilactobacillus sp. HBUAS56257]|uniref:McrB family protein n=1 Tax=Companilactobacillus sp. HBUAS56257 TaxID=3109360 RepID=UPI002FF0D97F